MKKRFLILLLVFCFGGTLASCKSKSKDEVKEIKQEENKINVTQKEVKENIVEEKNEEKDEKKPEENKQEKGLTFSIKDLGNNNVIKVGKKDNKISFDIYTVGIDFKLKLDGKEYSVKEAISSGVLDEDKLFDKLEADKKSGISKVEMYKDGGTMEYKYKDYTIIKYNTIEGDEDMYITKEKDLNALESILNKGE